MGRLEMEMQSVVSDILRDYDNGRTIDSLNPLLEPNKEIITGMLEQLFHIVYPGYFKDGTYRYYNIQNMLAASMEDIAFHLNRQIGIALRAECGGRNQGCRESECTMAESIDARAECMTIQFFRRIPEVRAMLSTDLEAFYDGDPAAENVDEIILAYPGFYAITVYRLAHVLYLLGVPLIPRIMSEHAHSRTGIDINPGASIGRYFFIDHGTGIVIGETTSIGEHVKIYQGVTLGALSTRGGRQLQNKKRHPTIEDNVTIYSGASILGGDTVIGHDCVIGGNVFITGSVEPDTRVSVRSQELRFDRERNTVEAVESAVMDASWCQEL
ncbi:serine O-acetyltransferase EpsC [Lachnoclostridium sp. Marseille-P6806]|uniref:serine O-acetyltransferase EpsC n=1 Tax=Lachnoclostridium sp. Marseille-P6806 TaxID=2364793 RepID=UPI0010305176|nr:serine O-acetyltransferase EpsC [Lachnoclostridium sp. Marseille-P6806]